MVRRPSNWNTLTDEAKTRWLQKQSLPCNGGRKSILKENDRETVWSLFKKYENKSLVAELLGVNQRTVRRYLKKYPTPNTFVVKENMQVTDYSEIKVWLKRLNGFANKKTSSDYKGKVRQFFEWMKKFHPERAKPSMWTSDDILEYLYGNENIGWNGFKPYQWHKVIVPLRSLALKAPKDFPHIDLGILPTKKNT